MGAELMAKKSKQREEEVQQQPDHSQAVIAALFKQIGKPKDLLKATAVNVYHTRYRVNIFRVTPEDNRTHITDTYFLVYDPEKGIVNSNPPLVKKY